MKTTDDRIQEALSEVRKRIMEVVRHEQLHDPLTKLPNDSALIEKLEDYIGEGKDFWCAFVEIDHFKRINDRFGYENADAILQRIADHLSKVKDFFPNGAEAFRAHGDEFYIVGALEADTESTIPDNLDRIRASVEGVKIPVAGMTENMNCTVSVGWLLTKDARQDELTSRGIRLLLQDAVSHAKRRGRNCIVKFTDEIRKYQTRSIRDNCKICKSAFTVDIPLETEGKGNLHCPNCGEKIERPPTPAKPPNAIKA